MIKIRRVERFKDLKDEWNSLLKISATDVIFLTYEWQEIWWKHFGKDKELHLLAFYDNNQLVGIAPLNLCEKKVCLNGGRDVSDYLDIIAQKGYEEQVWEQLFLYFRNTSASGFNFHVIPEASTSREYLKELCQKHKCEFIEREEKVTLFIDLLKNWDEHLSNLDRKRRHEIKRKMGRIERETEDFKICYLTKSEAISANLEDFFELHRKSAPEKQKFMTPTMESFFRAVLLKLAEKEERVYLHFAEGDKRKLASTVSFVYSEEFLLYNSGFEPEYSKLAPGFVLVANTIKEAIDMKLKRYDFLRGGERYKYDLGAKAKKIYNLIIKFTKVEPS